MQQFENQSKENLNKHLLTLMTTCLSIYKINPRNSHFYKSLLEKEVYLITSLDDHEISIIISALNKLYNIDENISLLDNIININSLNPVIARINFIFHEQLKKRNIEVNDTFSKNFMNH